MANNDVSSYDTEGAITYIIGVLVWYAIGFGFILIDYIGPRTDRIKKQMRFSNVHQAVHDLHEQKLRNEILIELKDKDRRKKLWDIYFGTNVNHPKMFEKLDRETVESIIKQLDEQRRLLENTLDDINLHETGSRHSIEENK